MLEPSNIDRRLHCLADEGIEVSEHDIYHKPVDAECHQPLYLSWEGAMWQLLNNGLNGIKVISVVSRICSRQTPDERNVELEIHMLNNLRVNSVVDKSSAFSNRGSIVPLSNSVLDI